MVFALHSLFDDHLDRESRVVDEDQLRRREHPPLTMRRHVFPVLGHCGRNLREQSPHLVDRVVNEFSASSRTAPDRDGPSDTALPATRTDLQRS
jgi:hypothetical protein